MSRAAQVISEGQKKYLDELALAEAARPKFFLSWRKSAVASFEASIAGAKAEVEGFSRALAQNTKVMENLRNAARRELELWLRGHDSTYQQGLASEQFVTDWRNAVDLVQKILLDFIKAVGEARNLMVSGYNAATNEHTRQAAEDLQRAVKIGCALEEDIASVNALAEAHDRLLNGTVFENPFPRLPIFAAGTLTENAIRRPIARLQLHFDRIKHYCEELSREGIPTLTQVISQLEKRHTALQRSYMNTVWADLRVLAQAETNADKLDAMVEETEARFLRGEYA